MTSSRSGIARVLVFASVASLLACGEGEVLTGVGEDIRVRPESLRLTVGDSATIRASRYDARGRPTVGRFTFTSGPPMVAAVRAVDDSTAVVTALTVGAGPITVLSPLGGGAVTLPVAVVDRGGKGGNR
jgi:uncharacterized protein YjdB